MPCKPRKWHIREFSVIFCPVTKKESHTQDDRTDNGASSEREMAFEDSFCYTDCTTLQGYTVSI